MSYPSNTQICYERPQPYAPSAPCDQKTAIHKPLGSQISSKISQAAHCLWNEMANVGHQIADLPSRTIHFIQSVQYSKIGKYCLHRHILHGLPIAVVGSIACVYLFSGNLQTSLLCGALFGAIHYIATTALIESTRKFDNYKWIKAISILTASSLATTALTIHVLKFPIPYLLAIPLCLVSIGSQLIGRIGMDNDYAWGDECLCHQKPLW